MEPTLFVGWTLNYEMFFYLVFALGLWAWPGRRGVLVALALLGLLVLVGRLGHPAPRSLLAFYTDPLLLEFAAGMGLGLIWRWAIPAVAGPWARGAALLLLIVSGMLLLTLPLAQPGAPQVLTAGGPAAVAVAAALMLERWGWRVRSAWAVALGDASYAIYLTHPFVTQLFQVLCRELRPNPVVALLLIGLCLAAVGALGLLVHQLLERPMTRQIRQLAPA